MKKLFNILIATIFLLAIIWCGVWLLVHYTKISMTFVILFFVVYVGYMWFKKN